MGQLIGLILGLHKQTQIWKQNRMYGYSTGQNRNKITTETRLAAFQSWKSNWNDTVTVYSHSKQISHRRCPIFSR